ncbi:MAG: type II toxin-antitoxin system PemK/MazF family toxin [Burkholderiales bacterium]|nr:type II toxin-antitoxin system PemK/MazF family toxin [Burkholderiales bacterium]
MKRGEIWWASLREPAGSEPGYRRPVLIVSTNSFNESRINTVVVAVISTNTRLGDAPGNVRLPSRAGGRTKPSVVNVSQVITVDKVFPTERTGRIGPQAMAQVDEGLRLVLALGPGA